MRISPDPLTQFDRFLTGPSVPSVDLYLANPCRDHVDSHVLRQLAPTVFVSGGTVIVVRHALGLKHSVECDRIIYVMDDDWRAGLGATDLPMGYRAKLAAVEARAARRFEPIANVIVTGSERLAAKYRARYPDKRVESISPSWPVPPIVSNETVAARRIACLGAWSHRHDMRLVEHALATILEDDPKLEVVVSDNVKPSRALRRMKGLHVIEPMNWEKYRQWLSSQRFDVGIYPLRDTAFNQARSINKVLEYAQTGAVILLSDVWRSQELESFQDAVVMVPNDTQSWTEAIRTAIADMDFRRTATENLRTTVIRLDIDKRSRVLWSELLEVDGK